MYLYNLQITVGFACNLWVFHHKLRSCKIIDWFSSFWRICLLLWLRSFVFLHLALSGTSCSKLWRDNPWFPRQESYRSFCLDRGWHIDLNLLHKGLLARNPSTFTWWVSLWLSNCYAHTRLGSHHRWLGRLQMVTIHLSFCMTKRTAAECGCSTPTRGRWGVSWTTTRACVYWLIFLLFLVFRLLSC